jgi:phosphate:Na+ symporter
MIEVAGGIGLFLLGMMLLTDGLRSAAADSLRFVLTRLTRNRVTAATSGAAVTAVVQSSTATTVATIGFVSAGLLTFESALAVIVGANVGTTSTGWLVSLVGLKIQASVFALPLVAVGAVLRLVGRERMRHAGLAIAGFGLIFVGIDVLQAGMSAFAARVDLSWVQSESVYDRLLLLGVGAVMTVVMQSSSAAMATTATMLHTGTISLPMAAAIVIGQNVGTTLTAVVAGVGGATPARRTAVAHVLFNVLTGAVAFLFLPVVPAAAAAAGLAGEPAVALAAFHTLFNLLGLLLVLPLLGPFAALIRRAVPERGDSLDRHLDDSVTAIPMVAVEVARRTTLAASAVSLRAAWSQIAPVSVPRTELVPEAQGALTHTRRFLAAVRTSDGEDTYRRHLAVLHAIDHSERLAEAALEVRHRGAMLLDPEIRDAAARLSAPLFDAGLWCAAESEVGTHPRWRPPLELLETTSRDLAERRRVYRATVLEQTARGVHTPDEAIDRLEAINWVDRLGYHAWRAVHHLASQGAPGDADAVNQGEPENGPPVPR